MIIYPACFTSDDLKTKSGIKLSDKHGITVLKHDGCMLLNTIKHLMEQSEKKFMQFLST